MRGIALIRNDSQDFNTHQRATFCVYSGKGVHELRRFLRTMHAEMTQEEIDAGDPRVMAAAAAAGGAGPVTRAGGGRHGRVLGLPHLAQQQQPPLQIPPHNPRRAQPLPALQPRRPPNLNGPFVPFVPVLAPTATGRRAAPPTQQAPAQFQSFTGRGRTLADPSVRTSAPPALPSVQTAPDGWQWNQRTNTGSYATRSTAAAGAVAPVAGPSSQADTSTPVTRRARAGTVTRGNFRGGEGGDEDMRDRSDDGEDASFGEEDVEMS